MQKQKLLRPLLCAAVLSLFTLQMGACNNSADPSVTPPDNNPPEITQEADSPVSDTPAPSVTKAPDTSDDAPKEELKNQTLPVFSAEAGFYDNAFSLELSSEAGYDIYFTTDSSDPRTSDTASLYTKEISLYNNTNDPNVYSALEDITLSGYQPPQFNVDKGIVVRAVTKSPEGDYGAVISNSYFIGKTAAYYSDMKVISMATDSDYLFDEDTGAYMIGSKYYEWLNSDEYVPYDAGDVQNVTNYNTKGRETEFPVSIQVFEEGKPVYSTDVGARISGNWSRAHAQKSFRLYARKEYGDGKMRYAFFDGLTDVNGAPIEKFDKVTLRNGGNDYQELHYRDALIHDLTKDLAFDVMASEPCILFVDGEFWGFYMIREKTDGAYIESHYGIDKNDVAVIKNSDVEEGTEEDLEEFRDFCLWASTADMTLEENYNKFCASMDLQSLMDYIAVETYINNNDWANGGSNNWQVWHTRTVNPDLPKADGKWRFILYDTEFSTGLYGSDGTSYNYDLLNRMSVGDGDFDYPGIMRNLCKNDTVRQAFYDNYLHIMETCFDPDKVYAKTNTYSAAYGEAAQATWFRFGLDWAAWNYEGEVEQFKEYFRRRPNFAKRYLNAFCGMNSDEVSPSGNLLSPTSMWTYYGGAAFTSKEEENAFLVSVPRASFNHWDIQSQAGGVALEQGKEYLLSFDASSTNSSTVRIFFNRNEGWSWPECWKTDVSLTPELQHYEFRFVMESYTEYDWQFCLNFGKCTGDFVFKNATLTRVK